MRQAHSFHFRGVPRVVGVVVASLGLAGGCGGPSGEAGTAGGPCYGNGTCNAGLVCNAANRCINPNGTGGVGGNGTGGTGGTKGSGGTGGTGGTAGTFVTTFSSKINNELDLLFMIDDSSSMTEMQTKLYDQLPAFMQVLDSLPTPPSLHLAVVSSDMGAPSDSQSSIACTATGDGGQFQYTARGTCTSTSLSSNDTFISDVNGATNFSDPDVATVFQCIAMLGDKGCGFEHQLASIDRALGADGASPPSTNASFLRPEAYLGIVILTNEDDCSAPANTTIYSLNGHQQNIANPDGPLSNYRCNGGPRGGHLCQDPANGNVMLVPPLEPPADVQGSAAMPTLDLVNCQDNEAGTSALTPVSQFVDDIKALKPDPDHQIVVGAIAAPAAPYTVAWYPAAGGQNTQAGELWPELEHSCGAAGGDDVNPLSTQFPVDGSFGDPSVRITQFVNAFPMSVIASICDASYASSVQAIATKLGQLIGPGCITQKIRNDANGNPMCTATLNVENNNVYKSTAISNCNTNGNKAPCWTLVPGTGSCTGQSLQVNDLPANQTAQNESTTLTCTECPPAATPSGC
jgi:hypothetical protein